MMHNTRGMTSLSDATNAALFYELLFLAAKMRSNKSKCGIYHSAEVSELDLP